MPTLDIFRNDAFGVTSLTAAINEVPEGQLVPTDIDGLFESQGIETTSVFIEKNQDIISLVPISPRGAPGRPTSIPRRTAIPFQTLHLPVRDAVVADEVLGVRAFGSETETQTVMNKVQQKLNNMRRDLQATITFHRMGAIKGQILDSDGSSVALDLFTALGVSQNTLGMALTTAGTDVRGKVIAAKRSVEKVLGGRAFMTGWLCLCGEGFFDAMVSHANVVESLKYQDSVLMRSDLRDGFQFAGVTFREQYGKVGNTLFIGDTDAYLIPQGVPGLFITRNAPADYMETVGTTGLPYYAKQQLMDFDKGVELEAQANPLNICTRPRAVVKLTKV